MKYLISRMLALASVLAATGGPGAAEDLDSALAAQKKKAVHRVYSERALLDDRNLTVPRSPTEEEKLLDRKLREMESKADARPSLTAMPTEPRPVLSAPRQTENKSWLTAAVLSELESTTITNESDDSWLTQELARQKELKEKESMVRENALVDRLMREQAALPSQSDSPELDRLKKYQLTPPKIFGSIDYDSQNTPSYLTPQRGLPDPLAAVRPASRQTTLPTAPAPFSPEAARLGSLPDQSQLNSTRPAPFSLTPSVPAARKSSSVFSYDRPDSEPDPVVLSPLDRIRKASPINRANPFAEDHMPEFKTSIWQ